MLLINQPYDGNYGSHLGHCRSEDDQYTSQHLRVEESKCNRCYNHYKCYQGCAP